MLCSAAGASIRCAAYFRELVDSDTGSPQGVLIANKFGSQLDK